MSLGALVTVLALAFEPFFQQIVTYPERLTPVGQSVTWAAMTFVPESASKRRQGDQTKDPTMSLAIDSAFDSPDIDPRPSTSICPTGNCTWPTYSTLGVCHECQDVSDLLQYICQNNTSLKYAGGSGGAANPCGFRVNNTFIVGSSGTAGYRKVTSLSTFIVQTFIGLDALGPFFNTTVYANATLPIADFYIGYTPGGPSAVLRNDTPPVLLECLLTCEFSSSCKALRKHTLTPFLYNFRVRKDFGILFHQWSSS